MTKISLRKIKPTDKCHFSKWWRDKKLLSLTSGILKPISDQEVDEYFNGILHSKNNLHFMITANREAIGHISLAKRRNDWSETQIIIGDRGYRDKGFGPKAIKLIIGKAKKVGIHKIYLEVRPANIRAIRAYERCGFQKIKTIRYPKNKLLQETLRMELRGR